MAELYVNNNGEVIPNSGYTISTGNRAYMYGDGIFESVRIINGQPINLENHFNRIQAGAKALHMRLPLYFNVQFFEQRILELVNKSGIKEGGKCRISIDRTSGGTYFPESNDVSFFIDVYPYATNYFDLNSKGLEVDIYQDMKKPKDVLSNYKTKNGLLYVMTAIAAKEKNLDDLLISSERGTILESSNSNLFVVSNGVLYTPGLDEGCIAGTMRMQVINLALQHGIKVYECSILPQNLLAADEIFLTNAVRGITWVGGYRTKRYFNIISRKIQAFLNDSWKNQLEGEDEE